MKYVSYGVRELQAHIGQALAAAQRGERVYVTSRGKTVAVLVKADRVLPGESATDRKRRRLAAEGKIVLGRGGRIPPFKTFPFGGVSAQLLADRR